MSASQQTDSLYPRFSTMEIERRHNMARAAMRESDLDALVVYGSIGSQEILYLADFEVTREAILVFPGEGEPVMFIQMYNHLPSARRVSAIADVRWGGLNTATTAAEHIRERGLAERRIGIVGMMPIQHYGVFKELLPRASLVDLSQPLMQMRLVKSDEELTFLRKGAELSDRAVEALEREVRPGLTEYELAAIVERSYLGLGGKNSIHYMATTPMGNPGVCVPSQALSSRVIEKGDILITEISASYHGYPGQILRPFAIGTPPTAAYRHMYDVAVETFNRLSSVIRAGATTDEVLDAAEYIHEAGFTIYDDLVHSLGGGYLPPILRTRRTGATPTQPFTFKENMTIVIQPNIITEDERMGLQVGELVRVTPTGVESLHRYPLRFIQCALS